MNSHTKSKFILVIFLLLGSGLFAQERPPLSNDGFNIPFSNIEITGPENNSEVAFSLQLLLILTVLSLAPSIFVLMTGFLRIAIVFDFIKRSLSLQQVPPNQVLMGIALFLTLFIMWPTFTQIYDQGFVPMSNGEIGLEEFYGEVETPMREFMFAQMQNSNYEQIRLIHAPQRPAPSGAVRGCSHLTCSSLPLSCTS
jgi:flagellar biosynthetic protein FliP